MIGKIKKWIALAAVAVSITVFSCSKNEDPLPIVYVESLFETGTDEWTGDAAFYKKSQETAVGLSLTTDSIPLNLITSKRGLKLEATNQGDSLFLFVKRKITGLDPAKTYKVAYKVELASSYPDTLDAAGRIMYFKAGASSEEPVKQLKNDLYGISIKNGALARSGQEMMLLGNVANGLDSTAYRAITRTNANLAVEVMPTSAGEIWLCAGVNTKYKGKITLYFDRIYVAIGEKPEEAQ